MSYSRFQTRTSSNVVDTLCAQFHKESLFMDIKRVIFLFFVVALFSLKGLAENYDDSLLLDTLVEKGIITEQEATEIKKSNAEQSVCLPAVTKSFKAVFILQTRFTHTHQHTSPLGVSFSDTNRFYIRRLIPAFFADITENSKVMISMFFPSGNPLNTFDYEIDIDHEIFKGKLLMGYWMVNYATEEYDSCTQLFTPDRSFLCLYFGSYGDGGFDADKKTAYSTQLGFAGYHTGMYWYGEHPKNPELKYSLALVNSQPGFHFSSRDNGIGTWLTLEYETKNRPYYLRSGITFGYSSHLTAAIDDAHALPSNIVENGDAYGFNPFLRFNYDRFTFHAELMYARLEYGRTRSSNIPLYTNKSEAASPWGFYVMTAYKLFKLGDWGEIEPIFKFSYLNTDGRGVRLSDVVHSMKNNGLYDKVYCYYGGVNWYVRGRYLKYTVGFEYYDIFGDPYTGSSARNGATNQVVAQMQILF